MHQNCILLSVVIALLSSCNALLATADSVTSKVVKERETSPQIKLPADALHSSNRFLRGVKVVEDDEEERTFDDDQQVPSPL
ncbi:hypothetical protein PHYSODRAFT_284533 [Phytophthora sojae]|uniref:RxLR effector protein n=2 Tax=Phytophthora sojae TaxID=67593 RepID=G4YQD5_PHYSP|nr:hypothetical protein PHYSODRAFT_284533 [Phytophthora sojae]AEK81306.1 Avh422 [Phytophthora sojae]AEK81307.1 Avh422 [Phytophthora sojae]AEK81308.1 Avh422 [Phytophthora sojae]EGZ29901.1 hypothetical protein PHYSODRAFT_284533 [Phytophthora sojae]|eukprot:XP_009517176.1 hypothetical protein PHYSODRAFT_284533 [Phytophthora sojae]